MRKMKKVLIITYYWPPAGGPGVQRVLKFAKYLPQFGWEPVILTVENGNYPAIDEELVNEVPDNLKVYKTKSLEPFAIYNKLIGKSKESGIDTFAITKTNKSFKEKVAQIIRDYFFIPDARKGWKYYAVPQGIDIVKEEGIDLIFSSSPPHSLHLIAKAIAEKTNMPWFADFRDPWSNAFWLSEKQKKGFVGKKNKYLEQSVFKAVDHFSTVSQGVLDNYLLEHPKNTSESSLIYNGFDDDDFVHLEKKENKIFTLRYIGTLAQSQNPIILFKAIAGLIKSNSLIKVEFWGKFDEAIKVACHEYGLDEVVTFFSYVSHGKAVELMNNSDMLLLIIPFENSKGILTGKLYEYIATGNPILALGSDDSEAKEIIEDHKFGRYFSRLAGLEEYISDSISQQTETRRVNPNRALFSRIKATEQLADEFDKLIKN